MESIQENVEDDVSFKEDKDFKFSDEDEEDLRPAKEEDVTPPPSLRKVHT